MYIIFQVLQIQYFEVMGAMKKTSRNRSKPQPSSSIKDLVCFIPTSLLLLTPIDDARDKARIGDRLRRRYAEFINS